MISNKRWKTNFAKDINAEIRSIIKSKIYTKTDKEKRLAISAIADAIYLLGISFNSEKYSFSNGFDLFCKEIGIEIPVKCTLKKEKKK